MASRNKQSAERKLRRLVLAGNLSAAEQFLIAHLRRDPNDAFMQSELQRLLAGHKLLVTESAGERRRRQTDELLTECARTLSATPIASLPTLPTAELRHLRTRLRELAQQFKAHRLSLPEAATDYRAAIRRELRQRTGESWRRVAPKVAVAIVICLLLYGALLLCRSKSRQIEQELLSAINNNNPERVESALLVLDTAFHRFVSPGVQQSITRGNRWLTDIKSRYEHLQEYLFPPGGKTVHVAALPVSERAQIERELNTLPPSMTGRLKARWTELCEMEHQALLQQKLDYINHLQRPLPPRPALSGNAESDLAACREQIDELRPRLGEFAAAPDSYELSEALIAPVRERLAELQTTANAIRAYQLLREDMKRCRSYSAHIAAMQRAGQAMTYSPVADMLSITSQQPPENEIKSTLMKYGYTEANRTELQAMAATLVKGKPTFTAAYPATSEQVHLLEDLFTAPSLHRRLYRVTGADGKTAYTEQPPRIDYSDNRVYLTRSDLDPEQNMDNRNLTLEHIDKVQIRVLSAVPLMQHLGISRQYFFQQANIANLLSKVLNFSHEDCPALAQAYVYYTLLSVLDRHPHPHMTGIRHCPTMRRHAADFTRLARRHNLQLSRPGAWLSTSPAICQAESDFRNWFKANAGVDYCAEIRQNFGPLGRVGLQYSGYIAENGQPVIFRELPAGKVIWYMTADGFRSAPFDTAPDGALPFSPIFNAL